MDIPQKKSVSEGLSLYAAMAFIASTSMALYDTCTDGLALDTTPENERGIVQGMMVGGRASGILVMLLLGGFIAEAFGWMFVFYIISLFAIFMMFVNFGTVRGQMQTAHLERTTSDVYHHIPVCGPYQLVS